MYGLIAVSFYPGKLGVLDRQRVLIAGKIRFLYTIISLLAQG